MKEQKEILNFDYLNTFSGNSNDFLLKMIDVFLEQCPTFLEDLEKALMAEEWQEASKIAHKFVTSAKFMGMKNVELDLKKLESNTKQGIDLENVLPLFLEIKQTCIQAIEELELKKKLF